MADIKIKVSGKPGVGKTQLINKLVWMLAREGYSYQAVTSDGAVMSFSDETPRTRIKIREKQT